MKGDIPMPDLTRGLVETALKQVGVEVAGRHSDPLRWSVGDLATDLAPLLNEMLKESKDVGIIPEGGRSHLDRG